MSLYSLLDSVHWLQSIPLPVLCWMRQREPTCRAQQANIGHNADQQISPAGESHVAALFHPLLCLCSMGHPTSSP